MRPPHSIGAFLALAGALLVAASGAGDAAAQQAPAAAPSAYTIFLRGTPIGREDITIRSDAAGLTIVAQGRLAPPLNVTMRRAEYKYRADGSPESFQLEATTAAGEITVSTIFAATTATTTGNQAGTALNLTHTVSNRALILPNLIFSGYAAVARRLTGLAAGGELRFYVLPVAEVAARVASVRQERVQVGTTLINVRRYELMMANPGGDVATTIVTDENGTLVRVTIPAAGIDVVREDVASSNARTEVYSNRGDEPVTIPGAGFNIGATLTRPAAAAAATRLPAVVLLSGPSVPDRDGFALGIPIVGQLAGALADAGFLAVRYDKRGFGQSGGRSESATLADFAEDARAVVRWLANRKDIDPDRIAVVGHGEGAWVALSAAARERRIAAVVSVAGASGTGAEVLLEQQQILLESLKLPATERDAKTALQKQIHSAVLTGKGWDAISAEERRATDTPWFQSFLAFDPRTVIEDVRQPLLFVHGALDRQVPVAHADRLAAVARAEGRSRSIDVVIVRGVNHLLVPATTGEIAEYATLPDRTVSADVRKAVTDWLTKTLQSTRR